MYTDKNKFVLVSERCFTGKLLLLNQGQLRNQKIHFYRDKLINMSKWKQKKKNYQQGKNNGWESYLIHLIKVLSIMWKAADLKLSARQCGWFEDLVPISYLKKKRNSRNIILKYEFLSWKNAHWRQLLAFFSLYWLTHRFSLLDFCRPNMNWANLRPVIITWFFSKAIGYRKFHIYASENACSVISVPFFREK